MLDTVGGDACAVLKEINQNGVFVVAGGCGFASWRWDNDTGGGFGDNEV